jgi:hypothetical protein
MIEGKVSILFHISHMLKICTEIIVRDQGVCLFLACEAWGLAFVYYMNRE